MKTKTLYRIDFRYYVRTSEENFKNSIFTTKFLDKNGYIDLVKNYVNTYWEECHFKYIEDIVIFNNCLIMDEEENAK
jgi:hypothetical protein